MKIFHLWFILSVYNFYESKATSTTTALPATISSKETTKELKKIKRGVVTISQLQHQPGGHFHYYPFAHHQHSSSAPTYTQGGGYTVSQIRTYEPSPTNNVMKTAADNIHESQYYINHNVPFSASSSTTPPNSLHTNDQPTITPYFAMPSIINSEVSSSPGHQHHLSSPQQLTHSDATYQPHHVHPYFGQQNQNYVSQQTEFIPSPRSISNTYTSQVHPQVFFPIASNGPSAQTLLNKYNPQKQHTNYNSYPLNIVTPQTFTPTHRNYINPHNQNNRLYHYNTLSNGNHNVHQPHHYNQHSSTTASPLRHPTTPINHNRNKNVDGTVTPYPISSYQKKPSHLSSPTSYKKPSSQHSSEPKSKLEEVQENKEDYDDDRNDSEDDDEADEEDVPHSSVRHRTSVHQRKPTKYTSYKIYNYDDNDENDYRPQRYHRYHGDDDEDREHHSSDDYDDESEADTKIVKYRKKYSKRNNDKHNNTSNKQKKFVPEKLGTDGDRTSKVKKSKITNTASNLNKPKKTVEIIEGKYSNQVPVTVGHKAKKQYQANWYYSSVKNEE